MEIGSKSRGTRMSETELRRTSLENAMASHESRQRRLWPLTWLAVIVVIAGATVGILLGVSAFSDSLALPMGDPGGRILHEVISSVSETVPSDAQVLSHQYTEAKWINCSTSQPAHYGDVEETLVIRTSTSPSVVGTAVGRLMARHGWQYQGEVGVLSWSKNFTLPGPTQPSFFTEQVSLQSTPTSGGDASISTFDASAPAFGSAPARHAAFCGGPTG
jgi:hypothetical protein